MRAQILSSIRATIVLTILTGLIYPLLTTGAAQVLFPHQANGSLVVQNGQVIGSDLIGQSFAAPGYFHPRPSAAGDGYDGANSGGTNLGPSSSKLLHGVVDKANPKNNFDGVEQLAVATRRENGLAPDAPVPVDAVTRSASGLDPHISVANARMQVPRVARQRGLSEAEVLRILDQVTEGRDLGFLGEPRVNVLHANLLLDAKAPGRSGRS